MKTDRFLPPLACVSQGLSPQNLMVPGPIPQGQGLPERRRNSPYSVLQNSSSAPAHWTDSLMMAMGQHLDPNNPMVSKLKIHVFDGQEMRYPHVWDQPKWAWVNFGVPQRMPHDSWQQKDQNLQVLWNMLIHTCRIKIGCGCWFDSVSGRLAQRSEVRLWWIGEKCYQQMGSRETD